jgi:antitoxin component YwqK of YwqJK toxin-antitoxin module
MILRKINGKKNGEYKYYYMNGELKEICNYVNGVIV